MKNKRGFTLIELLAVIVILAIIALIAVPIILNMINNARKSAATDAAYGYIEAIEYNTGLSDIGTITDFNLEDGTYKISQINNLKVKGKKPTKGTVTLTKRKVSYAKLAIDGYWVEYDGKEAEVTGRYTPGKVTITFKNGETTVDTRQVNEGSTIGSFPNIQLEEGQTLVGWYTESTFTNKVESSTQVNDDIIYYVKIDEPVSYGTILYFDPVSEDKCDSTTFSVNSINNNTSTCYKWRVIGQEDNNLIVQMDHNLINIDAWSPSNNLTGPTTALNMLANSTWTRVPALNYTYDTTTSTNNYGVMTCIDGICNKTINGETTLIAGTSSIPVRARLITIEEFRQLVLNAGASNNSYAYNCSLSNCVQFYFSSETFVIGSNNTKGEGNTSLAWLVENTSANSDSGATSNIYDNDNAGYYTLSPFYGSNLRVNAIGYSGINTTSDVRNYMNKGTIGIRPVITMPKSVFSS